MEKGNVSILENVKINQNLICLIASFVFLWYLKDDCCYCWTWLHKCCAGLLIISIISVCITSVFYFFEYCSKKWYKMKCHKMRHDYIKDCIEKGTIDNAQGGKIIPW